MISLGSFNAPTHAQALSTPKVQAGNGRPYEIADSEVWDVPDPVSKRGYQVFVALPPSYAKQNQDLNVYLYVGAYEALRKGDRRYNQTVDMVSDNRTLEAALQRRKYPSLKLKSAVLNDEDHLTVAPRGFTQGLKYLLPAR